MANFGSPIVGEVVAVSYRTRIGADRFGDDVYEYSRPISVANVLINPSTTTYDRIKPVHPEAIECDLVLYFPREFDADMRGARVAVRGRLYDVVGSPERYIDENLPADCPWNLVVKLVRFDG